MKELQINAYDALARILTYPTPDFSSRVDDCCDALRTISPESSVLVSEFIGQVGGMPLEDLEELYVKTFDMNPASTLDLGWQLFGEEYNRGLFLVKLRTLMQTYELGESSELPDHLTHVLAVLARMDEETALDFATACIIPALRKVLEGVPAENPYHGLVEAVLKLLEPRDGAVLEEVSQ